MGKLNVSMMEFADMAKAQCLFCEKTAELKDGNLTRSDLVYWQEKGLLVLCTECVGKFLPRLIADTAANDPDLTWANAGAVFWRTRSHINQAKIALQSSPE